MSNLHPGTRGSVPHDKEQDDVPSSPSYSPNLAPASAYPETLIIVPIMLAILVICTLRECYLARSRDALQSVIAARRVASREERRKKAQKARRTEIEAALIVKTASNCTCNAIKNLSNATGDTSSTSSSSHDTENPSLGDCGDGEEDDETLSSQICAICLEPYVGGQDRVSWSRFQTCRHAFHYQCIEAWLAETEQREGSCPCCRGPYLRGKNLDEKEENSEQVSVEDEETTSENGSGGDTSDPVPAPDEGSDLLGCAIEEFTSFCIVHGLTLEEEHQCGGNVFMSVKPVHDQRTGLEEPLLRS